MYLGGDSAGLLLAIEAEPDLCVYSGDRERENIRKDWAKRVLKKGTLLALSISGRYVSDAEIYYLQVVTSITRTGR